MVPVCSLFRDQKVIRLNKKDDTLKATCPTCGKSVLYHKGQNDPYFPFCSERCKLIDLGKWLEEEHCIEGTLDDRMPERAGDDDDIDENLDNDEMDISG